MFWETERIREQNEIENQKALELQREEYQLKKQREEQLKILNFKEINYDFYLRLNVKYLSRTEFQKVLLLPITKLPDALYSLFAKGYKLTDEDKVFLNNEFKEEIHKITKEREMEIIYYLSLSTFYIKLKDYKLMFKVNEIKNLLFAILSFKTGKVIGYRFNNLKGVFNYVMSQKEHALVFLNSIEKFYGLNAFLHEDKKGSLRRQVIEVLNEKPTQNKDYDVIIENIFPGVTNINFHTLVIIK